MSVVIAMIVMIVVLVALMMMMMMHLENNMLESFFLEEKFWEAERS